MLAFLSRLKGGGWQTGLPVLLWLLLAALPGRATHLLGGEMSYRYLGPAATAGNFRYEVTVLVYVNGNAVPEISQGRASIDVGFYSKTAPGNLLREVTIPRNSFRSATPVVPNCPSVPPAPPVNLAKYITVVELPASFDGYYAFYTDNARNIGITNIAPNPNNGTGGESGNMTLYLDMAPPLIPNASPIFTDTAVAVICQGDTSIIINNALDPDGDRLTYSFGTPYGGNYGPPGSPPPNRFGPPPPAILYAAGYSAAQPFGPGAGNFAALNANTGISQYAARNAGTYVVAVDVNEYRTINGREVLVGRTRRDVQLITRVCPAAGGSPVLALTAPRSFTLEEGQPLTFPIAATTTPAGTAVTLKVNSVLLDGAGGHQATYNNDPGTVAAGQPTGIVSLSGNGEAAANFVYTPRCGEARATPYDVVVTATNQDCKRKNVSDVFRITVVRPPGPSTISGDLRVCVPGAAVRTYTAGGPVPATYRWRVQGGALVGAATGASVQVQWGAAAGTGRVVVTGYSALGCPTDSAVALVELRPAPALTITPGGPGICQGASVTLEAAVAGAPATQTYTWTGGGQTLAGARISVTPAVTTTYTVTSVNPAGDACPSTGQVTVTVTPLPAAVAGPARALCSGDTKPLGAAPVAGVQYRWSPAEGLSDATIANPTITLTNTTSAPRTVVYTLTATTTNGPGCQATGTVAVTVSPAVVALPGPALTLCAGQVGQLGAAPVAGTTYQWSPAEGLSNPNLANPTVRLTNPTSAPRTLTYTLTSTTAQGCVGTAPVVVTVNSRPAPAGIMGPVSVCPTVTGIVYLAQPAAGSPVAGPYQWLVRGGEIVSGQGTASITVNWGPARTNARVQLFSRNPQQCASDTTTLPVRVNTELQTARPTGPLRVCQADGPYPYQTDFTPGSSYSWTIVGGTQVSSSGATVQVRWTQPGTGQLSVRETSNPSANVRCLGQSETLAVTVLPSPSAALAIQGPARACVNSGPIRFTLPGGEAASAYAFELNGAAVPATGNTVTVNTDNLAPGTYTLTARETNALGCAGPRFSLSFIIDPRPSLPPLSGPTFVCPEGLTGRRYTVAGAAAGSTFAWIVAGGGTITAGQGTGSIAVDFAAGAALKTISVSETSPFGCAGPAASLTVRPDQASVTLRYVSVDPQDNTKVQVNFTVINPANNTQPVRILRRNAGTADAFGQLAAVPNAGTTYVDATAQASQQSYDYKVELTNGCGTSLNTEPAHTSIRLQVASAPGTGGRHQGTATLTWNAYQGFAVQEYRAYRVADAGPPVLLGTVPAAGLLTLPTPTGDANAASTLGFKQCFYVEAVQLRGSGSGSNQPAYVSRSNRECLDVDSKLAFYNIITPNHDGQNDMLTIANASLYPGNQLSIFTRWGQQIYATTNYRNNWGQDENVAPGVYYYLFKLPDGTLNKGWFEVVK